MMPLSGRISATLVAVATLAGLATHRYVLTARFWSVEPAALGTWASAGVYFLAALGPLLVSLWLMRRHLRRPATFQRSVDGTAFVVPASPVAATLNAMWLVLVASQALPYERAPGADRIVLATDPVLRYGLGGIAVVTVALALAVIWLPAPAVRLTPAGITVRRFLRHRDVDWEDLLPGGPHPVWHVRMRLLHRTAAGRVQRCVVPTHRLAVDPAFLASGVRHYAERPEHRAAIGTPAELERLEDAYTAWRATPKRVLRPA